MSGILRTSHNLISIDQADATIDAAESAVNLTDIKYDMAILGYCRNFVVGDYRQDTDDAEDFRSNVTFALKQDYILDPHLAGSPGAVNGADPTLVSISTEGKKITWSQADSTFTTVGDHGLINGQVIIMKGFTGTNADQINGLNATVVNSMSRSFEVTISGAPISGIINEAVSGYSESPLFDAADTTESFQLSEEDFWFIVPQTHRPVSGAPTYTYVSTCAHTI